MGGLAACTEMATAYAATREQFGRPIGSFQAVKHHCANMLVDTELSVAVTWDAARANGSEAELAATMAAGYVLPAYQRVALKNVQVHGGIGYTWEHDAHLFVRRGTVLLTLVGGQEALHDKVTELQKEGQRRRHSVDLPPEAEQYRRAAEEFRADLRRTDAAEQEKLWARGGSSAALAEALWQRRRLRRAVVIEEVLDGLAKPTLGLGEWVVPTLLQHGNDEQSERLIWPSLEGELRWCQLFSEPGAGSDAAAVATRPRRSTAAGQSPAEGVEQRRHDLPAGPCHGAHRSESAQAQGHYRDDHRPRRPRYQNPAADRNHRRDVVQRSVLRRRLRARPRRRRRCERRLESRNGDAGQRAGIDRRRFSDHARRALLDLLARHRRADSSLARDVGALLIESYAAGALNLRQAARAVFDAGPGIEGNIAKLFFAEHAQRVAELALRVARGCPAYRMRRRRGARLSVQPVPDHRGRDVRSPQKSYRRTHSRPAPRARGKVDR